VTNEGAQEVGPLFEHRLHDVANLPTTRSTSTRNTAERAVCAGDIQRTEDQSGRQAELRLLRDARAWALMGVTLGVLQNANGGGAKATT